LGLFYEAQVRGKHRDTEFLDICKTEGTTCHFIVKGTPQQNGVAEMINRTLPVKVRCMSLNAGLPKSFWAE